MSTRADLEAAARQVVTERQQRLDDLPTEEEIVDYLDGRLAGDAADRVREALVLYPELAGGLEAGELDADADADLGDDDVEAAWRKVRGRLVASEALRPRREHVEPPSTPATLFRRPTGLPRLAAWVPLAAGLVLAAGSLFLLQRQETAVPQVVKPRLLLPDGQRAGGGEQPPIELGAAGDAYLVVAAVPRPERFARYLVEIVPTGRGAEEPTVLWRRERVVAAANGTISIHIPARFLGSGLFRIRVYGEAPEPVPVASYTVRVREG